MKKDTFRFYTPLNEKDIKQKQSSPMETTQVTSKLGKIAILNFSVPTMCSEKDHICYSGCLSCCFLKIF